MADDTYWAELVERDGIRRTLKLVEQRLRMTTVVEDEQRYLQCTIDLVRALRHSPRTRKPIRFKTGGVVPAPTGTSVGPNEQVRLPHSRACGIWPHPHGSQCARDCPTCRGEVPT